MLLAGIAIALCTNDPIQICTTIGREYTIAHALGFSAPELLGITRNAIIVTVRSAIPGRVAIAICCVSS
ncbi:MAG: hypothetical protein KME50_32720 [Nostoc desertorum CM1-VF14]|nr:hypothetical protein [Nostoc desertorum CM1-VF14]